jgi:hypothetical protein
VKAERDTVDLARADVDAATTLADRSAKPRSSRPSTYAAAAAPTDFAEPSSFNQGPTTVRKPTDIEDAPTIWWCAMPPSSRKRSTRTYSEPDQDVPLVNRQVAEIKWVGLHPTRGVVVEKIWKGD